MGRSWTNKGELYLTHLNHLAVVRHDRLRQHTRGHVHHLHQRVRHSTQSRQLASLTQASVGEATPHLARETRAIAAAPVKILAFHVHRSDNLELCVTQRGRHAHLSPRTARC